MPWLPANIATWGASNLGLVVPDQLAYQIAISSKCPSDPLGFVNLELRSIAFLQLIC